MQNPASLVTRFEFYRFRFHFRAIDPVYFPAGKSGNVIRGALGMVLRDTASPAAYARLFEPSSGLGRAPSGLGDWPRPFVLRAGSLDGRAIARGEPFCFDVHVFDLRAPVLEYFHDAFAAFEAQGIGPGHGRVSLERVEQLNLDEGADEMGRPPLILNLDANSDPDAARVERVCVQFLTPTELKSGGALAKRPEFAVLFGRLRDRISTLRALYGAGPLELDFREVGRRAANVRMVHCQLQWEKGERKSGRTGQMHPLGGFTGEAEYQGPLGEFLPWLRAARWVGVGRQTVWGKGDVRVIAWDS
ncbi:MAG: CRISPR system precrRNA processing endoribonuclease RAMP protein Cas6 [Bryobacteraceae bacterium]